MIHTKPISRRRFIAIAAGAAAWPVAASEPLYRWTGIALGAHAEIQVSHPDRDEARRIVQLSMAEIGRLEKIFSLYRADSALSRLNRDGTLDVPPADLVRLIHEAATFHDFTGGGFDITVQPLWDLYARHHSGPEDQDVKQALRLIGQDAITAGARRITLGKPGMALTLNGIAQGYITDQVAALMRDNGIENVLVNMGEIRASGQHPGGRPWMAGLEDPENPGSFDRQVPLRDMALATSGGYGTRLGAFNHLFDPRTGRSAERYGRVSVLARRATTADALSTGMSFLPMEKMASCLRRAGATRVMLTHPDGRMTTVDA
jgi:FAD:protein FMN transferase